ncbi:ankyrin repeat domain-containing protein [Dinoroseobacter sp. S124A]|uniref:ankyrin repeat domain-containing protein n=1 Tax=Dinoroseobacter sp. S124A TaxID=3415128 RepID=UPI003C7B8904
MSDTSIVAKPDKKSHEFDIYYGADANDLAEINGALINDPMALDRPEELTGKTALTIAAADGNYLAAWYLLVEKGADPWIADNHGWMALDYARAIGHERLRQMLLEAMHDDLDGPEGNVDVISVFPRR